MDYGKFIEPSPGFVLIGYRRSFSNWVVERQRLIEAGHAFKLHRLATKRIVFEVEALKSQLSPNRFVGRTLVVIAVLLAVGGTAAFAVTRGAHASQASQEAAASSAPSRCSAISLIGVTTTSIESFESSGWQISSESMAVELGELHGFTFDASCQQQKLHGRLIALQVVNSWQIKRMVLVD